MENSNQDRRNVRLAVVAGFLLGCLAGALSMNAYHSHFSRFPREPRGERFAQMLDHLNLTAEQRVEVEQILQDSRAQIVEMRRQSGPRYREIRRETDLRLQKVLTPHQWQQWQQMSSEMRPRRNLDRRYPR